MGVLDEAIRQHLELKRAHGASEDELKRQEVEALGPARRGATSREGEEGSAAASERDAAAAVDRPARDERPEAGAPSTSREEVPDEVPADEVLEHEAQPPVPGSADEGPGAVGVFDVEELGRPGEPPTRQGPRGAAAGAGREDVSFLDAEVVDEEVLDEEELAEEELAEELAGERGLPEEEQDPGEERPGDEIGPTTAVEDEPGGGPPPYDETLYRPPVREDAAEADTSEYEAEGELFEEEEEEIAAGEPLEHAAAEDALLEEDDLVDEEEDLLEDEPVDEGVVAGEDALGGTEEDALGGTGEDAFTEGPRRGGEAPRPGAEAGREPAPEEDVLEETPEFLEETPEHERLWFEQKPPRDFDLDR